MAASSQQSFRLFRVAGITVSIHWSWFLIAAYEVGYRKSGYHSMVWNAAEYLTLFVIVLMHEFGHALACRQTGGKSEHITLWPLGGIAYVEPPPRPGALLWSIAAGPLVNVALLPVTFGFYYLFHSSGLHERGSDFERYLLMVTIINVVLLCFNLLPIYPLDGGQILRALLWFAVGRSKSLLVASAIGVLGGVAMIGAAFYLESIWFGVLAVFAIQRCWIGFKQSTILSSLEKLPRHAGFACPECGEAPPMGNVWICGCGLRFDTFATRAVCPGCGVHHQKTACPNCRKSSELDRWQVAQ